MSQKEREWRRGILRRESRVRVRDPR